MNQNVNFKEKRNAEAFQTKEKCTSWQKKASTIKSEKALAEHKKVQLRISLGSSEADINEFKKCLKTDDYPISEEDIPQALKKKAGNSENIQIINLKDGMPSVSEALDRMRMGLQKMSHSQLNTVKLIHGYGSTGRGGKIRISVRDELATMKQRKQIRNFILGEDFGPFDPASRELVEHDRSINRDPDYGRINHGITIVILMDQEAQS